MVPKYENGEIVGFYFQENNSYVDMKECFGTTAKPIESPTPSYNSIDEQRDLIYCQCKFSKDLMATYKEVCRVLRDRAPELWKFERIYARVQKGVINGDALFENLGEPPKSIIMDLPFDILKVVVQNLDFIDKLVLRKSCHSLRSYLVVTPADCKVVTVTFGARISTLDIDGAKVTYKKEEISWKGNVKRITTPFKEHAVVDFISLLKTPNLALTHLNVKFERTLDKKGHVNMVEAFFESLRKALNTLDTYRIHVQNLEIQCRDARHVTCVARHLKPVILEKMTMKFARAPEEEEIGKFEMRKIFMLDQFKMLKAVVLDFLEIKVEEIPGFYDLPDFEVLVERMSAKAVVRMKEDLSHRKFMNCKVKFSTPQDMRKTRKLLDMRLVFDPILRHNSPHFSLFRLADRTISISF